MEWVRGVYRISDDKNVLDLDAVYGLLAQTYWAANRSREQIERAVGNSLCLGLYEGEKQVGFTRAVTDYATFTWVCDVVVDPYYRGRGFGKWLIACLTEHPALLGTNMTLGTRDAHGLYEQYGFERREMMRRMAPAVSL